MPQKALRPAAGGDSIEAGRRRWERMSSNWLAEVGTDPRARAREIAQAHSEFLTTHQLTPGDAGLREVVARSWQRSAEAEVGQDAEPPVALSGEALTGYRAAHPPAAGRNAFCGIRPGSAPRGAVRIRM